MNNEFSILTKSGAYFDLMSPSCNSFGLDDIAHALGNTCRFGGHTKQYYSVAQHCVLVSQIVPEKHAWAALMHDAAEAFIGDLPTPIKNMLPYYQAMENEIQQAICERLDVPETNGHIKHADLVALATERRDLMSDQEYTWPSLKGITPLRKRIKPLHPMAATTAFTIRAMEIRPDLYSKEAETCAHG